MEFVRNSYRHNEIPEPTDEAGVLKYIEQIGRLCYRSDGLITEDSAPGFIDRLKGRKHLAMLEHYIFTIAVPASTWDCIHQEKFFTVENQDYADKLRFLQMTHNPLMASTDCPEYEYLISGSATAFTYLWATKCVASNENWGMAEICRFMRYHHPHMMTHPDLLLGNTKEDPAIEGPEFFNENFRLLSRKEVTRLPMPMRPYHDWMSIHFVVERSSTHDLVRHRPLVSYAQESTRYCNYGKKGLCFIIPCQFLESDKLILENEKMINMILNDLKKHGLTDTAYGWLRVIDQEARQYLMMLNDYNMTPQEAKSVIPHALRAEINITTYLSEWHHIFKMRADKAAYPQIQEVMVPLLNETIHEVPGYFDDLQGLVEEGAKYVKS